MMEKQSSGPLRILFAGSPAIALPSLDTLAALSGVTAPAPWQLVGVLTNPDKPKGRSGRAEPTPVAAAAERHSAAFVENGLPPAAVLKPETLKAEAREAAAALSPDLLVSFAYGRIFGPKFLSVFPFGGINIHPSLLPAYRGASPIQEAILRGDAKTGVCIQKIAPETDTGNILASTEIPLSGRETTVSLSELAGKEAAALLSETLRGLAESLSAGEPFPEGRPQEGKPSYCSLIARDSGIIDWNKSAADIDAMIRAYTPWPLARTSHNGRILFILEAAPFTDAAETLTGPTPYGLSPGDTLDVSRASAGRVLGTDKKNGILIRTGGGILAVTRLQYQARKALPWQAFLNGARDFIGARLNSEDA
ncbi:MAG: methionyl-tRNA formyltransferase [Treponema sp.]|jgi:methionyl-tRNA formyltransferase|nr:methionyl-tRNA formyltransferase [Treponema sp.]